MPDVIIVNDSAAPGDVLEGLGDGNVSLGFGTSGASASGSIDLFTIALIVGGVWLVKKVL